MVLELINGPGQCYITGVIKDPPQMFLMDGLAYRWQELSGLLKTGQEPDRLLLLIFLNRHGTTDRFSSSLRGRHHVYTSQ